MFSSPSLTETEKVESSFAEVEDYLAIGLRPMEYRPAVIRRAMHRSALPLASLHLDHPDRVLEQKLTSVVATGYRLLDPRRREDSIQRMMLGRIHPQFAEEVIRIAQARGNQRMPFDSPDEDDFAPTEGRGLSAVPKRVRRSRLSLSHRHYLADDGTNPWSVSLRSHDLLVERPFRRALRSTRRWVSRRYVAAGATVGLLLISFGSWRWFRDSGQADVAALAPEQVALVTELGQSNPVRSSIERELTTVPPPKRLPASMLPEPIQTSSVEPPVAEPLPATARVALVPAGSTDAELSERMTPRDASIGDLSSPAPQTASSDSVIKSPSLAGTAGPVVAASFVPTAAPVETNDSENGPPALSDVALERSLTAGDLGFLGRLALDRRDLGVLLSYEPGEWLSRQSFAELAERLGTDLTNASVEWIGVIAVSQPTEICFHLPKLSIDVSQNVRFDDEPLTFIEDPESTAGMQVSRVEIGPGQWTVRWSVSMVSEGMSLRVTNGSNREPILVQTPPLALENHPAQAPTQWRLRLPADR